VLSVREMVFVRVICAGNGVRSWYLCGKWCSFVLSVREIVSVRDRPRTNACGTQARASFHYLENGERVLVLCSGGILRYLVRHGADLPYMLAHKTMAPSLPMSRRHAKPPGLGCR